jgi:hypothetical protein
MWSRGECDPLPSTHEHAPGDGGDEAESPSWRDRPITLVDIGRVLGESARVDRLVDLATVRMCRDDLTLLQEALSYARAILQADVAILSQGDPPGAVEPRDLAEELAGVLAQSPPEDPPADPGRDHDDDPEFDEGLFVRTDHLLAPHRQMALVNLSSPVATFRLRGLIEEQLAILTDRQAAIEARLQQIRAVIIRRYRAGLASATDKPA